MSYLLVFVGGGLGASLRHLINVTCARCLGTAFPWGTFIINITGSTVMGLIAGYLAFKGEASQPWRLFLMTGILGGYTTFSAYSLDAALLYERGELGLAALHDMELVRDHFPETLLLARGPVAWGPTAEVLTAENLMVALRMCEAFDDTAAACAEDTPSRAA